jgi:ABC-type nitrate/sulfonate/bicarbonate transport system ATPase subunit
MSSRWGSTPRLTDWLTVSRNVTLTLTYEAIERVCSQSVLRIEKLVAEAGDQFGNSEEGDRWPLDAANKQRVVKAEKTLYVL